MARTVVKTAKKKSLLYYLKRDWILYLFLVPVLIYYIVFKYAPMYGLVIAFKKYNVFKGVFASPWNGLANWKEAFSNRWIWKSTRNTLVLNLATLAINFPLTIILSLFLNEIRHVRFKKVTQSLLYLPHFMSWVVVAGIAADIFAKTGILNRYLAGVVTQPIPFVHSEGWWIFTYAISNVW